MQNFSLIAQSVLKLSHCEIRHDDNDDNDDDDTHPPRIIVRVGMVFRRGQKRVKKKEGMKERKRKKKDGWSILRDITKM